ncbi:hypothetical protein [Paenibacillus oleatilyticus]|uniref:YhzD-like protein n=1 Tax=Paenibacillus oleatilyticus TaxID=2594886 RepID=A0ABV4VCH0_9BACL
MKIHIVTYEVSNSDGHFTKCEIFEGENAKYLEGALRVLEESATVLNVRLFEADELKPFEKVKSTP